MNFVQLGLMVTGFLKYFQALVCTPTVDPENDALLSTQKMGIRTICLFDQLYSLKIPHTL